MMISWRGRFRAEITETASKRVIRFARFEWEGCSFSMRVADCLAYPFAMRPSTATVWRLHSRQPPRLVKALQR